jgi:prepilin-type N-terminal cleavage/methylation domain-containing protein
VRRSSGFTILEIIVVLLLLSILAATLLGRSITTGTLEINSQTDIIRNHLRFAQSLAMKRTNTAWGIKFEAGQYGLIRGTDPGANQESLPGVDNSTKVILPSGISLSTDLGEDFVYFDRLGKPYDLSDPDPTKRELKGKKYITVTAGTETRIITITPETGLIP